YRFVTEPIRGLGRYNKAVAGHRTPKVYSNLTNRLLIQPRSDEYGSVFGRPCATTCTSTQLFSAMLNTFTLEPNSAIPIGALIVFAIGRRLTSVVVTPSLPTSKLSLSCVMDEIGFQ